MTYLLTALVVLFAVEAAIRLPLFSQVQIVTQIPLRVIETIASTTLSDNQKQREILKSSGAIFVAAFKLVALIAIIVTIGLLPAFALAWAFPTERPVLEMLSTWEALFGSIVIAMVYVAIRKRLIKSNGEAPSQDESEYGPTARMLHSVALGFPPITEASFDINRMIYKSDASTQGPPVFIAGLARAGTTILMRSIYSTGVYRSLTYRDMPFVLMPNIWSKFSSYFRTHRDAEERAHGDRIKVNYDSPEAFEEVFWRTFCQREYIKKDSLRPHEANQEVIEKFRKYVSNVVASAEDKQQLRYLSKNNNNLLRLGTIRKAFPDAVILIPYRDPIQHALSLQTQHERFTKQHDSDPFSLNYMNWLGHHEFGQNHKPFVFPNDKANGDQYSPEQTEYWLDIWARTYRHALQNVPQNSFFIGYERLCNEPVDVMNLLFERLGSEPPAEIHQTLQQAPTRDVADLDHNLVSEVHEVYQTLERNSLGYASCSESDR